MAILGSTKVTDLTLLDGVIGNLNPVNTGVYDLGTSSLKWRMLYSNVTGDLTGNASSATKLKNGRTFQIKDADNTNAGTASSAFTGESNLIINLPSTIKATLSGNASTATKLSSTPNNTTVFLRGDNTWTNTLKQSTNAVLGIDSNLKIGTAKKDFHIEVANGSGTEINSGNAGGITFGDSSSAYAGIYYQTSGNYGTKLHFATTDLYVDGSKSRMIIDSSGRIGINTLSPSYKLEVNGTTGLKNTVTLGSSGAYTISADGSQYSGNAATATKFASSQSVALTGDVTGSASSQAGWSIATTIGAGKVTNAMLAGSIANGKLANSKVTIAGNDVSLGGSLTADTLRTSLGLSNAMHFKGTTTTTMSDGLTTAAVTIGGSSYTPSAGDVVLYSDAEFVWTGSAWERLGRDSSFKTTQSAVSDPSASGTSTTFIKTISQDANGVITPTKASLPTASNSVAGITKLGASGGAATYEHTHGLSIATDSGTNQLTLAANTKYKLTAGGSTYIFTTPPDNNTWRGVQNNLTSDATDQSLSAAQGKALKALIDGKTSNTGTVTSVATGVGLTGGTITGSGTVKAKLRSETALTNDSAAATETSGRVYPVAIDKSGYLAVNVPWTNVNSSYLTSHQTVSNKGATLAWGTSTTIATIGSTNINVSLPSNPNSDTKNTAGSTDTSSKIFLIGATSQAASPQTYSDNQVYATNGQLDANKIRIAEHVSLVFNTTTNALDFVFA